MRRPLALAAAALLVAVAPAGGVTGERRGVKVLGGAIAAPGQFPWAAALVDASARRALDGAFCGGTVIAPQVVLTAAHCTAGSRADEIAVVVGRTRLSQEEDGERIAVQRIEPYPGYDRREVTGDLALLRLARPTDVPALAIARAGDAGLTTPAARVLTLGWGATSEGGKVSDELRFVRLTVRSRGACDAVYGRTDGRSQLCVGSSSAGRDSCQGDSGGPLVGGAGDATRLVGIVSYGEGCGRAGVPGVYTRVSAFAGWIDERAAALNGGAAAPPPPPNPPVVRIGRISCPAVYCDVDLRVRGRDPAGGIVLNVVRRRSRGRRAIDTFVFAKRVADGRWRVHVNLPFGTLTLYAIPLTAAQDDLDGDGDVQRVQIVAG